MRGLVAALLLISAIAAAAPAPAMAEPPRESPADLLDEAAQKLLLALKAMLMAVPQYAAPEINENGDVIIRRIRPKDERPESPAAVPEQPVQTRT